MTTQALPTQGLAKGVHCCVCVNTSKVQPPALTGDTMHVVAYGAWDYVCCHLHAGLVKEHGLAKAIGLQKHADQQPANNPTRSAT
jgi:hypothetical protein